MRPVFRSALQPLGKAKRSECCPKFTSDPRIPSWPWTKGAQEAAKELQVSVEFNGPVDANVAAQANIIDQWIRAGMDAITVSANDPNASGAGPGTGGPAPALSFPPSTRT